MKYRRLGKTDLMVSEIGFGCTYFRETGEDMLKTMFDLGMDKGINFLDHCLSGAEDRDVVGRILKGRRDKMIIQGHLGFTIENQQEARTQDLKKCKDHLDDLFRRLGTDYMDITMLHCIDQLAEYEAAVHNGVIDYMLEQKKKGVFRYLGFSSHNVEVATTMVKSGNFDVVMFSISPLFDLILKDMEQFFTMTDTDAYPRHLDIDQKRVDFYTLCEERGVGITAMKALAAGSLVEPAGTPFGSVMTAPQCIHYALNRPAVGSVFVGMKDDHQLADALSYYQLSSDELDYSHILNSVTGELTKRCLYCNHCLPCPSRIDIGNVTRLLDSALTNGVSIDLVEKYRKLPVLASTCTKCEMCIPHCPFGIDVVNNMTRAVEMFESAYGL